MGSRLRPLVAVLVLAESVHAAGGAKLWQLGPMVEENPIVVFSMFTFTVVLTVAVELLKHKIEHNTHDPHRQQALGTIYAELMMVGVVSFLLIISAELGLTDLKITWFCDEEPVNATDNTSASGSASTCGIGFDLLMFEYAHLVIFFMGIMYCAFIQIAFWQRDRLCKSIREVQEENTLMGWYDDSSKNTPESRFGPIGMSKKGWARTVLTLRAVVVLKHREELRRVCRPSEDALECAHAQLTEGTIPPEQYKIKDEEVVHYFDMARFAKCAYSETMLDLMHVPPAVWASIVVMAGANLIHKAGLNLADAVAISAGLGPLLASLLLWRLSDMLHSVVKRGVGHPELPQVEFHKARGRRQDKKDKPFRPDNPEEGILWSKDPEQHPWSILEGCIPDDHPLGFLDPLDPIAIERQIQVVIFASCFYIGQLAMLSPYIGENRGPVLFALWLFPLLPLTHLIPRAIMVYSLVHRTCNPPRSWLRASMRTHDDSHHGHHGHGHEEDPGFGARQIWLEKNEEADRKLLDVLSDKYPPRVAAARKRPHSDKFKDVGDHHHYDHAEADIDRLYGRTFADDAAQPLVSAQHTPRGEYIHEYDPYQENPMGTVRGRGDLRSRVMAARDAVSHRSRIHGDVASPTQSFVSLPPPSPHSGYNAPHLPQRQSFRSAPRSPRQLDSHLRSS